MCSSRRYLLLCGHVVTSVTCCVTLIGYYLATPHGKATVTPNMPEALVILASTSLTIVLVNCFLERSLVKEGEKDICPEEDCEDSTLPIIPEHVIFLQVESCEKGDMKHHILSDPLQNHSQSLQGQGCESKKRVYSAAHQGLGQWYSWRNVMVVVSNVIVVLITVQIMNWTTVQYTRLYRNASAPPASMVFIVYQTGALAFIEMLIALTGMITLEPIQHSKSITLRTS